MQTRRPPTIVHGLFGAVLLGACGRAAFDFPGDPVDGSATTQTTPPSGLDGGDDDAIANETCDGAPCSCPFGKVVCGSSCVALASNPLHCGGCGVRCDGTTPVCNDSQCRAQCTGGRTACAGACVDLKNDIDNCGECAAPCSDGRTCDKSKCECLIGQTLCGNRCVDTMNDRNNCGTCGKGCPSSAVCGGGTCL